MTYKHHASAYRIAPVAATGWRTCIGWISFGKRAAQNRALLRKMTYKNKASCASSPPCSPIPAPAVSTFNHIQQNSPKENNPLLQGWLNMNIYLYTYMCIQICISTHVCIHIYINEYICVHIHIYMYIYTPTYIYIYIFMYAYTYMYSYLYIYIHLYV